jgi:hypothetical protein
LRDDYQASIRAAALYACLEDGIEYPCTWSFWGNGDQATDSATGADANMDYGGMLKRTVADVNNHAATAIANGGTPQAALGLIQGLRRHFLPDTPLYELNFTAPGWRGLGSPTKMVITNESPEVRVLSVEGSASVTFTPWQIKFVDRP